MKTSSGSNRSNVPMMLSGPAKREKTLMYYLGVIFGFLLIWVLVVLVALVALALGGFVAHVLWDTFMAGWGLAS
jgi:hypothetical protein